MSIGVQTTRTFLEALGFVEFRGRFLKGDQLACAEYGRELGIAECFYKHDMVLSHLLLFPSDDVL